MLLRRLRLPRCSVESEAKVAQARDAYLAAILDGEAKSLGVKLGSEAAIKAIASFANDGNDAPDA